MVRIAFVGAGRVGTTLAHSMHAAGFDVVAIFSRQMAHARAVAQRIPGATAAPTSQVAADASDLVFLTVPDDAIETSCARVTWRAGQCVVHCSGATELSALRAARDAGALVGAFHPLQMFANPEVAARTLPGCTITIEADPPLLGRLDEICRRLGCRPLCLPPGRRALYHASAYYVGPFVIALMREAAEIWRVLGMSEHDALSALVPLLQGTVAAVLDQGLAGGMGGCVARGDVGTVQRHLRALDGYSVDMANLYRQLAIRTIPLGVARGTLDANVAARMQLILEEREENLG